MPNRFLKFRLSLICTGACYLLPSCSSAEPPASFAEGAHTPPTEELFSEASQKDIVAAARAIIAGDPVAALVTVDEKARPRVRSVNTSAPDSNMSIWIATRPTTRKVDQIQGNHNVTLYYNDDAGVSYVSIMGTAVLHTDLATIETKNPFNEAMTARFWPNFPEDVMIIEVRPVWLEVMGQGIATSQNTWRPQAAVFDDIESGDGS